MIPDWIYISQTAGTSGTTTITVSAGTNQNTYEKGDIIKASNGVIESNIILIQRTSGVPLSVNPSSLNIPAAGGIYELNVATEDDWYATYPSWITGNINQGTGNEVVSITAATNTSNEERIGFISFETETFNNIIEITQNSN